MEFAPATSVNEVRFSAGDKFYFDGTYLHVKPVGILTRSAATLYDPAVGEEGFNRVFVDGMLGPDLT